MLEKAKVCVSPGIGFGDQGDEYVRFALIENEARIRQALRGIKPCSRNSKQVLPCLNAKRPRGKRGLFCACHT
jgi:alanine-synthesizing transaminase